jgi:putative DNA primase/helicase
VVVLCEGYATALAIHLATGWPVVVAWDSGNLPAVAADFLDWRACVLVAGDDDFAARGGNAGAKAAERAAQACGGVVVLPRWGAHLPRGRTDTDFDDLARAAGRGEVRAQLEAARRAAMGGGWLKEMQRNKEDALKVNLANLTLILTAAPEWAAVLAHDDFAQRVCKRAAPPWGGAPGEWLDADTAEARVYVCLRWGLQYRAADVEDAVLVAARRAPFHPVRDFLRAQAWDGECRLSTWLADYLGAEADDYTAEVGACWLLSAVARVMRPGVKADGVLILEGGQGRGKSTALRILAGEWFSDTPLDLGTRDSYASLQGCWLVELAELDSLNKADAVKAKAFFSSGVDRFRPSYGHRVHSFPRQCVFAGTTNLSAYLKDPTGARRFWPVNCEGPIRLKALEAVRSQLWAEAFVRFERGEIWWPGAESLPRFADEAEARYSVDVWESAIDTWLNDPERRAQEYFEAGEIMQGALNMQWKDMKPPEQTRVGLILKRLGWEPKRRQPRRERRRKPGEPINRQPGESIRCTGYQRPEAERLDVGAEAPAASETDAERLH